MEGPQLVVGSLFTGIGGLEAGLHATGRFRTAWMCEADPACQAVLRARFPGIPIYPDIRTLPLEQLGQVDVVCGGFPCQDLSTAGKRAGIRGDRSGLWFEMLNVIQHVRPSFVLVENVSGLLHQTSGDVDGDGVGDDAADAGGAIGAVLGPLSQAGYDAQWETVSAASVGSPQLRNRVFIMAWRRELANTTKQSEREPDDPERANPRQLARPVARREGRSHPSPGSGEVALTESTGTPPEEFPGPDCGSFGGGGSLGNAGCVGGVVVQPKPRGGRGEAPAFGQSGPTVADVPCDLRGEARNQDGRALDKPGDQHAAYPDGTGLEGRYCGWQGPDEWNAWPPGPTELGTWAGVLERWPFLAPAVEPPVCRVVDGVPARVDLHLPRCTCKILDRLKGLGNAVSPPVARVVGYRLHELAQRLGVIE